MDNENQSTVESTENEPTLRDIFDLIKSQSSQSSDQHDEEPEKWYETPLAVGVIGLSCTAVLCTLIDNGVNAKEIAGFANDIVSSHLKGQ